MHSQPQPGVSVHLGAHVAWGPSPFDDGNPRWTVRLEVKDRGGAKHQDEDGAGGR